MNQTRRSILATGIFGAGGLALVACGAAPSPAPVPVPAPPTPTPTPTPAPAPSSPSWQQIVTAAEQGFSAVTTDLTAAGVAIPTAVTNAINTAEEAASAVLTATSTNTASGWTSAVDTVLSDISGSSIATSLPTGVQTALQDIEALLPIAEVALNIAGLVAGRHVGTRRFVGATVPPAADPYADLINYINAHKTVGYRRL
jgi:hypothetical protein